MPGNSLLTIDMITAEAVRLFKNSNLFIMNMDTQYDPAFAVDGAKIGSSLRIRLPNDYVVTSGPAMQLQNTAEKFTTLNVVDQKNVAVPFTSAERTMAIDDYSEIILAPMINALAGKVAQVVMEGSEGGVCNFVSNVDGNNNIIRVDSEQFLDANATLTNNSADAMDRRVVVSPTTNAKTTKSLQGLLNPTPEISAQFRSGQMKSGLGFGRWFEDQTVINHRSGSYDSTAPSTVNGADQTGTTIEVNALNGSFVKGDMVTFEDVNEVNRVTKQNYRTLRQFVILEDVAAGATEISIYPSLIPYAADGSDQQYQTVDASPLNGADILMVTKANEIYSKNIAYVQKAVTLATADLVMPTKAVEECARANYDGVAMRILTDYLPNSDQLATRVDVLFGFLYIRPEWLCVIADKVGR